MEFTGKKWTCVGEKKVKDYSEWWAKPKEVSKPEFQMTSTYRRYLAEKRKKELELRIRILRSKLDYQMAHDGRVDEIDYAEFMTLIGQKY